MATLSTFTETFVANLKLERIFAEIKLLHYSMDKARHPSLFSVFFLFCVKKEVSEEKKICV